MSADSALPRARRAAERLMVDTCEIRRAATVLYQGRCRVQTGSGTAREAGDAYVEDMTVQVHLPMRVTGLQVGDEVTVTAGRHDPDLAGRVFRIQDLSHQTHATARRAVCAQRTGAGYLRTDDDPRWIR